MKKIEEQPQVENNQERKPTETLIQCEKVCLRECSFNPVNPEEHHDDPQVQFAIQPVVFDSIKMISELKVCLLNLRVNKKVGFLLKFTIVAYFKSKGNTTKEQLGEFGQLYSLSILWPYAREFAQTMFARSGFSMPTLPVINPTSTTDDMLKQGLINVIYQNSIKEN